MKGPKDFMRKYIELLFKHLQEIDEGIAKHEWTIDAVKEARKIQEMERQELITLFEK
jgi:hypothetical protein